MIGAELTCLVGYVDDTRRRPIPPPKPANPIKPEPGAQKYESDWFYGNEPGEQNFADVLRKMAEAAERARKEQGRPNDPFRTPWTAPPRNPFYPSGTYTTGAQYRKPDREPRPKKPLECTKCHKTIETGFVGPPQVFVCTECQWDQERETTFVQVDLTRWEYHCSKCRYVVSFAEMENLTRPLKCPKCDRRVV
jgi:DNA-directed RNA polymerase subunit RPC12/RpoP